MLSYLFELFDPVLHMDDFELLTLLAGETRSMGDLVHRWLRKLLLVEIFLIYNEMDRVILNRALITLPGGLSVIRPILLELTLS